MQRRNIERQSIDLNSPFYLYRREVQAISLLSKEDELALHQAIEFHLQAILKVCTEVPECLQVIHDHFEKIVAGELKLETLLYGFTPSDPHHSKPEVPEVQQRLFNLLVLQYATQGRLIELEIDAPETKERQGQLLECLSGFKWTAQVIEKLVQYLYALEDGVSEFKQQLQRTHLAFKQAKQALVASHLRLVFFVAKKYAHLGAQFLDLVQEGNIGLIQAIERFDYRWGYAFSSYATVCIKHAIFNALSKIRLAATEGDGVLESLEDEKTPTPMEVTLVSNLCKATQNALSRLPAREANILRLRFGIGVPCSHTLEEVGEVFKISRERIRQIEVKALKALRDQVETSSLKTFLEK